MGDPPRQHEDRINDIPEGHVKEPVVPRCNPALRYVVAEVVHTAVDQYGGEAHNLVKTYSLPVDAAMVRTRGRGRFGLYQPTSGTR